MKSFLEFISEAKTKLPTVDYIEDVIDDFYSEEDLREHYISGELFKEGALIEQLSTGKVGTVMRRGANYLICLTDEGEMFKPWITDSKEIE
ncbi:MAG: hypothetical protein ACO25L_02370 [Candidatus Nanopelagicales bacterium]|nr:cytidyltransferase [Synechococcus phage DSL-LC03]